MGWLNAYQELFSSNRHICLFVASADHVTMSVRDRSGMADLAFGKAGQVNSGFLSDIGDSWLHDKCSCFQVLQEQSMCTLKVCSGGV